MRFHLQWTCHVRPLPWKTTCLEGPHNSGSWPYFSMNLNLLPNTTCLDHIFYNHWSGLLRQVLLYKKLQILYTVSGYLLGHCDMAGIRYWVSYRGCLTSINVTRPSWLPPHNKVSDRNVQQFIASPQASWKIWGGGGGGDEGSKREKHKKKKKI